MATEASPFEEERQIEDDLTEELLVLLATSLVFAVDNIVLSRFSPVSDFEVVQQRFRSNVSEAFPQFISISQRASQIALDRAERETPLRNLTVDYSDSRFMNRISEVFDKHVEFVLSTNREMFNTLRSIALENGWSDEELARRLKRYYGLTPRHMQSIVNMENALIAEGVNKSNRQTILQRRIDQLVEWRLNLIATQLSTEIVESSKDAAFSYLASTGQVNIAEYEKEWVSVIDENTTQICTSSHRTRAQIGRNFSNGRPYPPAYPPVHPCRSAIRLVKII